MTTNNPDPLEVWEEAYGAFVFADDSAQYQAAAAIIAQHYAPVIAENEALRAEVTRLKSLSGDHFRNAKRLAKRVAGAKP